MSTNSHFRSFAFVVTPPVRTDVIRLWRLPEWRISLKRMQYAINAPAVIGEIIGMLQKWIGLFGVLIFAQAISTDGHDPRLFLIGRKLHVMAKEVPRGLLCFDRLSQRWRLLHQLLDFHRFHEVNYNARKRG